jgi:hypothetical protein
VDDPRTERIHANNRRFRQANEKIRDRAESLGADMDQLPFLCECPVEDCVEILRLTRAQYKAVRDNPHWYVTAVGHEEAEKPVAVVVSRNDGYVVVEKGGDGGS